MASRRQVKMIILFLALGLVLVAVIGSFRWQLYRGIDLQILDLDLQLALDLPLPYLETDHILVARSEGEEIEILYDRLRLKDEGKILSLLREAESGKEREGDLQRGRYRYRKAEEEGGVKIAIQERTSSGSGLFGSPLTTLFSSFLTLIPFLTFVMVFVIIGSRVRGQKGESPEDQIQKADKVLIAPLRRKLEKAESRRKKEEDDLYWQEARARQEDQTLIRLLEGLLDQVRLGGRDRLSDQGLDFSYLAIESGRAFQPLYLRAGKDLTMNLAPGLWARGQLSPLLGILVSLLSLAKEAALPASAISLALFDDPSGYLALLLSWDGRALEGKDKGGLRGDPKQREFGALLKTFVTASGGQMVEWEFEGSRRLRVLLPRILKPQAQGSY